MRQKKEKTAEAAKPRRGRPRIKYEVLVVPKETLRMLRAIADEARLPLQLVYEDAILNGLSTLTGPEGMYASAINFRKTRDKLINREPDTRVAPKAETNGAPEQLPVPPSGDLDPEFRNVSGEEVGSLNTTADDLEQRGLLAESIGDPEFSAYDT